VVVFTRWSFFSKRITEYQKKIYWFRII
jgi:hypothetical protein